MGATIITPPIGWAVAATGAVSIFGYLKLKIPFFQLRPMLEINISLLEPSQNYFDCA